MIPTKFAWAAVIMCSLITGWAGFFFGRISIPKPITFPTETHILYREITGICSCKDSIDYKAKAVDKGYVFSIEGKDVLRVDCSTKIMEPQ